MYRVCVCVYSILYDRALGLSVLYSPGSTHQPVLTEASRIPGKTKSSVPTCQRRPNAVKPGIIVLYFVKYYFAKLMKSGEGYPE